MYSVLVGVLQLTRRLAQNGLNHKVSELIVLVESLSKNYKGQNGYIVSLGERGANESRTTT